jgi:hypothetical protein
MIRPFIVDVVLVSPSSSVSASFSPPVLTSATTVSPSSSSSSHPQPERKMLTVPTLDVWFHGSEKTAGGDESSKQPAAPLTHSQPLPTGSSAAGQPQG